MVCRSLQSLPATHYLNKNDIIGIMGSQIKKIPKPTLKQVLFAKEYVRSKGNGTRSALKVYNTKNYESAHAIAKENLQKLPVLRQVEKELEAVGLSSNFTDTSLRKLIEAAEQNYDQANATHAVAAIRLINELRDRFPAQKRLQANLNLDTDYHNKDIDELKEELRLIQESNQELLKRIEKTR